MKTHLCNRPDPAAKHANNGREQVRRRQTLTIIFAIVLISIAGVSSAQSPQTAFLRYSDVSLQQDGTTAVPVAPPSVVVDHDRTSGGAIPWDRLQADGRPVYVELGAALANFDADADPDGWHAYVVLRDRKDRPVVIRARATFELMPRVATTDHRHYVNAGVKPIRWSMPLEFDEDSVARLKLPLRQSLRPMLGWTLAEYPQSGIRTRNYRGNVHGRRTWGSTQTVVASDLRTLIGTPGTGELRVRVSVPTEGVFEAATPVQIRPSVLVDTQWPYR